MTRSTAAFASSYQNHAAMRTTMISPLGNPPRRRYRLPLEPPLSIKQWPLVVDTQLDSHKLEEISASLPDGEDDTAIPSFSTYDASGNDADDIEELLQTDAPTIFRDQTQKITGAISSESESSGNVLSDFAATMSDNSIIWLNVVAVIWGSQHAVIKTCVEDLDPSSFSLVRFMVAAIIATPAWLASSSSVELVNSKKDDTSAISTQDSELATTWRWGAEMGFWMFLGYAFQAVGLAYTTAQRSGFFLYLNVKLVPFFAFILLGRKISIPTWVSAFTALTGTGLLAYDGTGVYLNNGDLWSLAAAAASAMFILRMESASAAVPNAAGLNASCLWVVALASLIWSASLGLVSVENLAQTLTAHPLELLYLSAVTTALANWIQTKAQKNVTAERASVIYAMDPVWGAIWSNLLLGETLSSFGIMGAGLITIAAATNAFLDLGSKDDADGGNDVASAEKA